MTTKNNSTIADDYVGEVGKVWKASYALVNYDGKTRCAWCNLPVELIEKEEDINKHIDRHDKTEKEALHRQREELLDSFEEIIGEVEKVNESNGRYNAISEIRNKITALRSSEGEA